MYVASTMVIHESHDEMKFAVLFLNKFIELYLILIQKFIED